LKFVNVFGDTSRTFLHDDQGQLTGWQEYANTTPNCVWDAENGQSCTYGSRQLLAQATYGWDKAGNPTHGGAVIGTGNRLTSFNGFTLEYDAEGNLTRKYSKNAGGTIVLELPRFRGWVSA
jgi:hypothetical protein